MIVVDVNVVAARHLVGLQTPLARMVEQKDSLWVVPPLWQYEFQNTLAKYMWAKQISRDAASVAWTRASSQFVSNESVPSAQRVMDLAARFRITAYDATYIALAIELSVLCVTEDEELQSKFPSLAVSMQTFVQGDGDLPVVKESRSTYHVRRRKK